MEERLLEERYKREVARRRHSARRKASAKKKCRLRELAGEGGLGRFIYFPFKKIDGRYCKVKTHTLSSAKVGMQRKNKKLSARKIRNLEYFDENEDEIILRGNIYRKIYGGDWRY